MHIRVTEAVARGGPKPSGLNSVGRKIDGKFLDSEAKSVTELTRIAVKSFLFWEAFKVDQTLSAPNGGAEFIGKS